MSLVEIGETVLRCGSFALPFMKPLDTFAPRHLGSSLQDIDAMVDHLGFEDLEALIDDVVPEGIRDRRASTC